MAVDDGRVAGADLTGVVQDDHLRDRVVSGQGWELEDGGRPCTVAPPALLT